MGCTTPGTIPGTIVPGARPAPIPPNVLASAASKAVDCSASTIAHGGTVGATIVVGATTGDVCAVMVATKLLVMSLLPADGAAAGLKPVCWVACKSCVVVSSSVDRIAVMAALVCSNSSRKALFSCSSSSTRPVSSFSCCVLLCIVHHCVGTTVTTKRSAYPHTPSFATVFSSFSIPGQPVHGNVWAVFLDAAGVARCTTCTSVLRYLDKRASSSGQVTPSSLMGGAFLRPLRCLGSCGIVGSCAVLLVGCAGAVGVVRVFKSVVKHRRCLKSGMENVRIANS